MNPPKVIDQMREMAMGTEAIATRAKEPMPMPAKKTKDELLRARAAREEAAAKLREAHELHCLELEDRFCAELGPRGQKWQLVNEHDEVGCGPICLKPAEITAWKLWQSKGTAYEDMYQYVSPSLLYPERTVFNEIVDKHPDLLAQCVSALSQLAGFTMEALRGKR